LVTPPQGICLDPFAGSGTTGIACKLEGFEFVGIEQDADSCKIAETRIESWVDELDVMITREIKEAKKDNTQLGLEL
jgi:DNA modification methylase